MGDDPKAIFKQRRLNTRLLEAVHSKNLEKVQSLLANGANPDTRCRVSHLSVCHIAAYHGNVNILTELLKKEPDVTVRDIRGLQPHHMIPYNKDRDGSPVECLKLILDSKNVTSTLLDSKVDKEDQNSNIPAAVWDTYDHNHDDLSKLVTGSNHTGTVLHIAVKKGRKEIVEVLLKRKAIVKKETIALYSEQKQDEIFLMLRNALSMRTSLEPLQMAVLMGNVTDVKECLRNLNGAKIPPTSLHLAIQNNRKNINNKDDYNNILRMLLEQILREDIAETINSTDENLKTPLYLAIEGKWMDDVDLLLEKGADIGKKCGRYMETVFHAVARNRDSNLLRHLLEAEPSRDVLKTMDVDGFTPLYRAIKSGSGNCVEALLETNEVQLYLDTPCISGGSVRKCTLLHVAIESSRQNDKTLEKIIEYLTKRNISIINDPNSDGLTAVELAAEKGEVRCLDLLFQCKDLVITTDSAKKTDTPLHYAAKKGYYKCAEKILDRCVGLINMADSNGLTALIYAAKGGYSKCVKELLERGANLAAREPELGRTAIDVIMSNVPNAVAMIDDLLDSFIGPCQVQGEDGLTEVTTQTSSSGRNTSKSPIVRNTEQLPLIPNNNNNNRADQNYKLNDVLLDYKCLVAGSRQLEVIEAVNDCKYQTLQHKFFLHPLVKSFLFCKWKKINFLFLFLLAIYTVHVLSVTGLALFIFVYQNSALTWICRIGIWVTIFPVILVEILSRLLKAKVNSRLETYLKWLAITTTGALSFLSMLDNVFWIRYFSSFTVLLAWMELLLFYAMGQKGGFYILLFFKVARNVFQVFSSFLCLIFGFAMAFCILFDKADPFSNPFYALGEVLAMLSELNYDDTFENDGGKSLLFKILGRSFYLGFYMLVVMVMMNLIVGLSVNVVTAHEGQSKHLAMQGSFLSLVDKFCYSDKTSWLSTFLKKHIESDDQFKSLTIHPNQSTENNPLDKELLFEVTEIVNNKSKNCRPERIIQTIRSMQDTLAEVLENINK